MIHSLLLVVPAGAALQVEVDPYETVEQIIKIGIAALSLLLLALSLSAYRRTQLRGLLYAAAAFGLFAVQMAVEFLEDVMGVGRPYGSIVTPGITFAVLVLFFLAIVRKGPNP